MLQYIIDVIAEDIKTSLMDRKVTVANMCALAESKCGICPYRDKVCRSCEDIGSSVVDECKRMLEVADYVAEKYRRREGI